MADRIAVMSKGVLQAYDVPEALYDRPKTLFVAAFVGNPPMNFFDVEVMRDNGDFRAKSEAIDLVVPHDRGEKAAAADGKVIMGMRPEDVNLADDASPHFVYDEHTLRGAVERLQTIGAVDRVFYAMKANSHPDILRLFYEAGLGFECVSPGELEHVRTLFPDLDPERLLFTPNFAPAPSSYW